MKNDFIAIVSDQINQAKERILVEIVQKLEGRTATVEDGLNFSFKSFTAKTNQEFVFYKNEFIGAFEVSIIENTVTLTFNSDDPNFKH